MIEERGRRRRVREGRCSGIVVMIGSCIMDTAS